MGVRERGLWLAIAVHTFNNGRLSHSSLKDSRATLRKIFLLATFYLGI
jgi:hypothetical protein